MYVFVGLLILATVLFLAMSAREMLAIEAYIYVFELLVVGTIMTLMTAYLTNLMKRLFGEFFVDEKNTL
jgi:hypothetical protein